MYPRSPQLQERYKMSSGAFSKSKYAASYGDGTNIHPIRVQPETITCSVNSVANTAPTGAVTSPISALVSRGRRARGLIVRTVTLRADATTPPTGYKPGGLTTIPCLTTAFFNACAAATDTTTVSYLGSTNWKVSYVSDEKVR